MLTRQRTALLLPLSGFLLVFFVAPLVWLLSLAVREAEVPRALPRTLTVLQSWQAGQAVPPTVFASMAQDLREAREASTLADAARRLNYEVNGVRSTLMRAAREIEAAPAGTVFDAAFFNTIDPTLTEREFFAAVQRAHGPVSGYYLLAAFDLARNAQGDIERVSAANRIYVDVLLRTLGISASVTLLCLLLGFPVAMLLTQVTEKTADWLMILVLLPFWTSLLVRTAAWVVVLQREGMVNSLLMRLGFISEPLTLIYNRTGVLIAMTHVLLPFMILPLYSVLKGIPSHYMRAAASLGAPPLIAFFRVYLPMAAPAIAAGSVMVFILAMGYYITPALVGGGSDQMLSYFVATYTTDTGNWGLASALGLMMLLTTLILYAVAHKLSGGRALSMG
ncbi:MAG: ABC transporter permease [Rhodoferax sp.]|uniref:ABC transporter permease n=1 Tax=Rhodoferax sp. TaxID=50421 RepID=UPI00261BC0A0|nr:ABC transporter permease [Rhodoferax sp.]MDD5335845.1 ABC transporter permease [Rhodoferax sp.]